MARRGTVLEFRRPRPLKRLAPGPVRTGKLRFTRKAKTGIRTLLAVFAIVPGIMFCLLVAERWSQTANASAAETVRSSKPLQVYWVDGDSGTIDGRRFRLYGVDAPEGSQSRAECSEEQTKADAARSAVRILTSKANIEITQSHSTDKYDRALLTLSADGRDVASALIASGNLKRWNYESGAAKPNWCG